MSKPPKIDRKELRHPDQFQKQGTAIFELLVAKKNPLIALAGAVVLAVFGFYGYSLWQDHKNEVSWNELHEASKGEEKDKWEKYKKVYVDNKGTRASLFAATALADNYFEEAKKGILKEANATPPEAALAVEWYGNALEFSGLLPAEKQLLTINKGNAVELSKNYDEAMKLYQTAADAGGNIKGYALLNVARVWELKGDKAKAQEIYEKISADFVNTEYAKLAKNSLRRMKNDSLSSFNL